MDVQSIDLASWLRERIDEYLVAWPALSPAIIARGYPDSAWASIWNESGPLIVIEPSSISLL
jgi:hypothetical protein